MKYNLWIFVLVFFFACKKSKTETPAFSTSPYPWTTPNLFAPPITNQNNPLTKESVELGRHLFYEPALAQDLYTSCASCHQQQFAFSDTNRFSIGVGGALGSRQSMALQNLAWNNNFFWDHRATSLEDQIHFPIQDVNEMNTNFSDIVLRLKNIDKYDNLFQRAYNSSDIDSAKIVNALANFLRTLVSANSKYDKVKRGETVFTAQESLGYTLFNQEGDINNTGVGVGADCFHCHNESAGLFAINDPSNNGLDPFFTDLGVGAISGIAGDNGKFKVPSLRNVEYTPPYMHDGRFKTLEDVIMHYNAGGHFSETISPFMKYTGNGLNLSQEQQQALLAFLKTLSDPDFITEEKFSNPN